MYIALTCSKRVQTHILRALTLTSLCVRLSAGSRHSSTAKFVATFEVISASLIKCNCRMLLDLLFWLVLKETCSLAASIIHILKLLLCCP
ncbi:hypothetical protein RchiOBHm_Chr5g0038081 [Rosa chinensis]|uniref:Uncharacterized protein n=1 Tax=Rosa chinensis TaxID=74649 RepID=A0A2P6QBX4_ROSCH|nr:hypothetical protein RchiOBHm_Chr5g0038081 [Rosa chinensis]